MEGADDPPAGCLDVDVLVAMADGMLAGDRLDGVLDHVDQCASCAELVASLGAIAPRERVIGRYRLERMLGSGGMGVVYVAYDPQLDRRVAVKLVRPDKEMTLAARLAVAESRTLAGINHPNVVAVYDAGEHDGEIYFATELVDGTTLAEWQVGRSTTAVVEAWIQAARGLAAAHQLAIIHRDVKPTNVLVGHDGRVRVGDFGIAHHGNNEDAVAVAAIGTAGSSSRGLIVGTPAYMAPEQRSGKLDARSDQFATAVAVTEALTSVRPRADAVITGIRPRAIAAVLQRALRADPEQRYPTMTEFADALTAAIAPARRRGVMVGAAAAAVGAVAVAVAVFAVRSAAPACEVAVVPDELIARRARLIGKLPSDPTAWLDHWMAQWRATASEVCAADDDVADGMRGCLDDALGELARLFDRWDATPPRQPLAMFIELEELPRSARCAVGNLRAAPRATAVERALAAAIKGELASGVPPAIVLEHAYAIGLDQVAGDLAISLAKQQADSDHAAALATLERARPKTRGLTRAAVAAAEIPLLSIDRAIGHAAELRRDLAALGGDPSIEYALELDLGSLLFGAGRHDDARLALERARHAAQIAFGVGAPQEALVLTTMIGTLAPRTGETRSARLRSLITETEQIWQRYGIEVPSMVPPETPAELIAQVERVNRLAVDQPESESAFDGMCNLVNAYRIAGDPVRALARAREALALAHRLKLRSPRVAYLASSLATLEGNQGDHARARELAREAVAVATEADSDGELASALTILGRYELAAGNRAAARAALEQAIAIRVRNDHPSELRGVTRAYLALAEHGRRARDLATVAREELRTYLDSNPQTPLDAVQRGEIRELIATLERQRGH